MKTQKKLLLTTALVLAGCFAFAQQSAYNKSTGIVFRTDVDYFMSTTWWQDAKINKTFGYVGGDAGVLNGGFAMKLPAVYFGGWYDGNFLGQYSLDKSTVTSSNTVETGTTEVDTKKVTTRNNDENTYTGYNNFAMLIGVGNIGIKLGYTRSGSESKTGKLSSTSGTDGSDVNTIYTTGTGTTHTETVYGEDGYYNNLVSYEPSLYAGMSIPLAFGILKPNLGAMFRIIKKGGYWSKVDTTIAEATTTYVATTTGIDEQSCYEVRPQAGIELVLNGKNNLTNDIALSYVAGIPIYNTSYLDAEGNSYSVKGTYQGTTSATTDYQTNSNVKKFTTEGTTTDHSELLHVINLSWRLEKKLNDRLSLGSYLGLNGTIYPTTTVATKAKTQKTNCDYLTGDDVDYDEVVVTTYLPVTTNHLTVSLSPVMTAGATYYVVPEKFKLNAGLFASINWNYEKKTEESDSATTYTTTTRTYADGKVTTSTNYSLADKKETATVTDTLNELTVEGRLGFTYFFSENVTLDCMVTNNIFAGGFFNSAAIGCTMKF